MPSPEPGAASGTLAALRRRHPRVVEFALFCAVGPSGVAVDCAVFAPLREAAHMDPRLAAVFAFSVAVSWNYVLNRRFTFAGTRQTAIGRSYGIFVAVCAAGLAVRVGGATGCCLATARDQVVQRGLHTIPVRIRSGP